MHPQPATTAEVGWANRTTRMHCAARPSTTTGTAGTAGAAHRVERHVGISQHHQPSWHLDFVILATDVERTSILVDWEGWEGREGKGGFWGGAAEGTWPPLPSDDLSRQGSAAGLDHSGSAASMALQHRLDTDSCGRCTHWALAVWRCGWLGRWTGRAVRLQTCTVGRVGSPFIANTASAGAQCGAMQSAGSGPRTRTPLKRAAAIPFLRATRSVC